ncbi:hypothetical protein DSLPV1_151 [Dishui lake phycodnavirus 1]|uniref:hypothetical protein n=1 Tax=Dishui lake phycodnavirus 1 TaxID=2079134 RepID=UPI000CD6A6FE|nr:hypothetical protein C5Y57_gp151 [Dishui lake phycodnavirus 1]AUT19122.1 hypothetical protein DSLPV1_151 [Dishui lake phycodnavirus 1]
MILVHIKFIPLRQLGQNLDQNFVLRVHRLCDRAERRAHRVAVGRHQNASEEIGHVRDFVVVVVDHLLFLLVFVVVVLVFVLVFFFVFDHVVLDNFAFFDFTLLLLRHLQSMQKIRKTP